MTHLGGLLFHPIQSEDSLRIDAMVCHTLEEFKHLSSPTRVTCPLNLIQVWFSSYGELLQTV